MLTQDLPTAVVRLIKDCLNARSTAVMGELFDTNYVHRWGLDGELSLPDYTRVMGVWFSAFPDFHVEPEMSLTGNDLTCVRYLCTGTHLGPLVGHDATGRTVTWRENFWYRVVGDRIVEDWEDYDFAGILSQLTE